MIPANELRIGSWTQQEINGSMDYSQVDRGKDLADVSVFGDPIPISKELLYKLGFEWEGSKETHLHLLLPDIQGATTHLYFYYEDGGSECTQVQIWQEGYFDGGMYLSPIKYLHQLQNLFFVIIGTELNITL